MIKANCLREFDSRTMRMPCGKHIDEYKVNGHFDRCLRCAPILTMWDMDGIELLKAMQFYDKRDFYVLYSGGKDSGCLLHWALNVAKPAGINIKGVVAVDTTIALPEWRVFIKQTCKELDIPLTILQPPKDYAFFVRKFGFPHASRHNLIMSFLKWRPLQLFEQQHRQDNICFLSGVRRLESDRRFGNVQSVSTAGSIWLTAPILNWSDSDTWEYFKANNIARSPAYEHLNISGDCNCGAFASTNDFFIYEVMYPEIAAQIKSLTKEIAHSPNIKREAKIWGDTKKKRTTPKSPAEYAICSECAYRVDAELDFTKSLTEFN